MHRNTILGTLALVLVTACTSSPAEDDENAGSGGAGPATTSATVGGQGGTSNTTTTSQGGSGGQGGMAVTYETTVGAAYPNGGDGRIVLIDGTGTRTALYNPGAGTFESADDIDELEGGIPLTEVIAAARLDDETYFFDASGNATIYDHTQASYGPVAPLADVLDDIPFASVGAAFGAGTQLFVFDAGGASYAAYNTSDDTWSPVYSFLSDFGGGGTPIASVGAAYAQGDGSYVLFDHSGTSYCVYTGGGQFSNDFDIEDLGNGLLTFNDLDDD